MMKTFLWPRVLNHCVTSKVLGDAADSVIGTTRSMTLCWFRNLADVILGLLLIAGSGVFRYRLNGDDGQRDGGIAEERFAENVTGHGGYKNTIYGCARRTTFSPRTSAPRRARMSESISRLGSFARNQVACCPT